MAQQKRGNGDLDRQRAAIRAASVLLDRMQWSRNPGLAFSRTAQPHASYLRDLGYALGYKESLLPADYRARYERGGICERICEAYPRGTWAGGATLQEDADPEVTTEFEQAVVDLFDRLDIWARLLRADILAGLGRYAVLLIGAEGELLTELPRLSSADDVLYLSPLPEDRAVIRSLVSDASDSRFGLAESYDLTLASGLTKPAHWTRVLHVAEGLLEDDLYGKPRLRAVWNRLDDLDKVIGGGAEAAWRRADPGIHADIDPEMEIDATEEDALREQIDEYIHNLRRVLRTRGVRFEMLSASVAAFGGNAEAILQQISAATGIPHRILTGSERGELASTQDRNNWNERIAERRREFAIPLVRELVNRLIEHNALPRPQEYEIIWPDIDELDEAEKAQVAARLAQANVAQWNSEGVVIVTADEIRDQVFGLAPLAEVGDMEPAEPEPTEQEADEQELADMRAAADLARIEPDEPEWRSVHRAADASRERIVAAVDAMHETMTRQIDYGAVRRSLEMGNRVDAARWVHEAIDRAEELHHDRIEAAIKAAFDAGGEAAMRSARARGSLYRAAQVTVKFDAVNPRAVQWASERAALSIKEINNASKLAIRDLIEAAFLQGVPPASLARQIREHVGLLKRQSVAVSSLKEALRSAKPGDLIVRFPPRPGLRSVAGFRARVPRGGPTAGWVNRNVDRYSTMQRNLRSRTIARTEAARAANAGQRELWLQNRDAGLLPQTQQREWIAVLDDRTRDEHAALHGYRVGLEEPFPGNIEPGDEINCRCAQGLVRPERAAMPIAAKEQENG